MALNGSVPDMPDHPEFLRAWLRQLLDPEFVALLRSAGGRQVEVRLYTSGGKVRRRPGVVFDAGHGEMVDTHSL